MQAKLAYLEVTGKIAIPETESLLMNEEKKRPHQKAQTLDETIAY